MLKKLFLGIGVVLPAFLAVNSALAQSYSNAVMALKLTAYWPLTESSSPPNPIDLTAASYGSLGAHANGSYGAWYQASGPTWYLTNNIVQSPAIASDGKARFCQNQPGQYVVIPRNTNAA